MGLMGKTESQFELKHRASDTSGNSSTLYDSTSSPLPYPDHGRQSSTIQHGFDRMADAKGQGICEAVDMYGDVETAEEYGYVKRGYTFLMRMNGASRLQGLAN